MKSMEERLLSNLAELLNKLFSEVSVLEGKLTLEIEKKIKLLRKKVTEFASKMLQTQIHETQTLV